MFIKLKRLMWNERYLGTMLLLFLYTLVPLLIRMWNLRQNGILYAYTAFEESFVLSVQSRDYYMPFAFASPLIAAVLCGNLYLDDKRAGAVSLMCIRESEARYHASNLLAAGISCFLLFLIPLSLNVMVSMIGFPLSDSMMGNGALATTAYHSPYRDIHDAYNIFVLLREHHPYVHISLRLLSNAILFTSFAVLNYGISVFARFRKYICNLITELVFMILTLFMDHFANSVSFVSYLVAYEYKDSFLCLLLVMAGILFFGLTLLISSVRRKA